MELKKARLKAGLTQAELADRAGVDTSLISRLETGSRRRRPSYDAIMRIARALKTAPDELFPVPHRKRGREAEVA